MTRNSGHRLLSRAARPRRDDSVTPTARRSTRLIALLGVGGTVAAAALAFALPASAHSPAASVTCTSWSLSAQDFGAREHNTYSVSVDGGPAATGTFTKSFAETGTFPAGSGNHTLLAHINQNGDPQAQYSTTYDLKTSGCTVYVPVPAAPSVTPPSCDHDGTLKVTPPGAHTTVAGGKTGDGPGTYTVTYTADSGYTFPSGDTAATYRLTVLPKLSGDLCTTTVAPVQPTVAQAQCTGPGSASTAVVHVPAVTGVVYRVDGKVVTGDLAAKPGAKVVVEATPADGFAFSGPQVVTYELTFATPDCVVEVQPVSPSFADDACSGAEASNGASYTIPSSEHVRYSIDGKTVAAGTYPATKGSSVVVTATADEGFVLTGDSRFTHEFPAKGCATVVRVSPVAFSNADCGTDDQPGPTFTIPKTTGVEYTVDGRVVSAGTHPAAGGSAVAVVAQAKPGYVLTGTARFAFSFAPAEKCLDTAPLSQTRPTPLRAPLVAGAPTHTASTGAPVGQLLAGGVALMGLGALALVGSAKRRRTGTAH
jgi:hypothetical protein